MLNTVFGLFLGVAIAGLAGVLFVARGYSLVPKKVKLPFADFEATRLSDLSPIKMFMSLSRAVISPAPVAQNMIDEKKLSPSPILLVHLAWHVVSEAYVAQYFSYPTEDDVRSRVADLGTQNVDFIVLFERVHSACIRDEKAIQMDFAEEYFVRAPSLAERITQNGSYHPDQLYKLASEFLNQETTR
ncbi:hypothetical protein [Sphingorhabdus sp. YGSMI21]|uniref:hypothetical protein n=1 Tax=Sphingorhabdus sp. YGSMI21 TaxID=2077182 RepID=UPI000C1E77C1|nr:hypothetical protein [Sphingorhabdus sp. YGSMI21]ATW04420.1 hypothetical protein CHN51_13420 [Sphingorhabdus sp. YGSMI21]